MDRGQEFMGEVRAMLRDDYGITRKPITTRNPQANAMVERAHCTIHNMIRANQIKDKQDLAFGTWCTTQKVGLLEFNVMVNYKS